MRHIGKYSFEDDLFIDIGHYLKWTYRTVNALKLRETNCNPVQFWELILRYLSVIL